MTIKNLSQLTTVRWLITHVIVILAMIVLANFGFWQLDRLEQRRDRNASITAALNAPTITLDGSPVSPDDIHYRQVQVTGQFDNEASIILRGRRFGTESGVHLVVPLLIEGNETAVLVNRGWIPRGNVDPPLAARRVHDVEGTVTVSGIAYPADPRPTGFAPIDRSPAELGERVDGWFRVDIERIQEQLPYELLPIYVEQIIMFPIPVSDSDLPRQVGAVELDDGPHLSYALQWFSFSAILGITYVAFLRQALKDDEA